MNSEGDEIIIESGGEFTKEPELPLDKLCKKANKEHTKALRQGLNEDQALACARGYHRRYLAQEFRPRYIPRWRHNVFAVG